MKAVIVRTEKPLSWFKPFAKNPKTHPPEQVRAIRAAMDEWGWTNPMLADERGCVIAGHGRLLAAKLPPVWKGQAPTVIARGWTDAQKRAYRIADNKLSESGQWSDELLRAELGDLSALGFDLTLTGFAPLELAKFGIGDISGAVPDLGSGVSLADRFGIAPFSVLNAREGWWQGRKRAWLALGIQSELGRGENLLKMSETILEPDPRKRMARGGQ